MSMSMNEKIKQFFEVKDAVAKIEEDYALGKYTREQYKDEVAKAEGRPLYTELKAKSADRELRLAKLRAEVERLTKELAQVK